LIYSIAEFGKELELAKTISSTQINLSPWQNFANTISSNSNHSLPVLLMQITIIILFARALGWICQKIGQPSVIGEILAGIALGPSLIGYHYPEFTNFIFPVESLGNLHLISQLGLILFMFVVGMELDLKTINKKVNDALVISHTGIIVPFTLGVGLSYFLYENFAPQKVSFLPFALFMGIAMSIAAFPVMARIVQERGLYKQKIGALIITTAAIDDITAWCLLAVIIAIVKAGSFISSLYTVALAIGYIIIMIKLIRPFLKRIGDLHNTNDSLSKPIVAVFFVTLLLSAYATEIIGIHPLFGAFMAGVIMPQDKKFRHNFIQKVEDISTVLFLPLFFVYTGLRTEIGLLNNVHLWTVAAIVCGLAVIGKFLGSALSARFLGQSWRNSLMIGSLMNTRGLMELVALNIGYDLGVLSPEIFAMFVIMALTTTLMTGPSLNIIEKLFQDKLQNKTLRVSHLNKFDILIAFASPQIGRTLLRLADNLIKKQLTGISVLHLSPEKTLYHYNLEEYEKESFTPLLKEAGNLNRPITTLFKASSDVGSDISQMANEGNYDLLLISVGQSIFEGSLLGKVLGYTTNIINPEKLINKVTGREKLFEGSSPFDDRTQQILLKSEVPVGIFMGKTFREANYVVLIISSLSDIELFKYIQLLLTNANSYITIYDVNSILRKKSEAHELFEELSENNPKHIAILRDKKLNTEWVDAQDLMIISVDGWKKALENDESWIDVGTSTLVIRP
jgi:Kef-type K+ transport system membrane component KefB